MIMIINRVTSYAGLHAWTHPCSSTTKLLNSVLLGPVSKQFICIGQPLVFRFILAGAPKVIIIQEALHGTPNNPESGSKVQCVHTVPLHQGWVKLWEIA